MTADVSFLLAGIESVGGKCCAVDVSNMSVLEATITLTVGSVQLFYRG